MMIKKFPRRYRVRQSFFCKIMNVIYAHDFYFVQHKDTCGHLGLPTIQKCIVELEMLAYGIATNATNGYCHMDERIMTKCFQCFVKAI